MEKEYLLNEFYQLAYRYRSENYREVKKKLSEYIHKKGYDRDIDEAILVINANISDRLKIAYKKSQGKLSNMLLRLTVKENLDTKDIMVLAMSLDYTKTYVQAHVLLERAIATLEQYSNTNQFNRIKIALYSRFIYRLIKAKYFDMLNELTLLELENLMEEYIDKLMAFVVTE